MAGSEQARKIAERAEDQLGKVADTVKEKFDQLTGDRPTDRNDRNERNDQGQDQTRQRVPRNQGR